MTILPNWYESICILKSPCCYTQYVLPLKVIYSKSLYRSRLKNIGTGLKRRRLQLRISQMQLAQQLNVRVETIQNSEYSRSIPAVCHLPKLIDFLGYELCVIIPSNCLLFFVPGLWLYCLRRTLTSRFLTPHSSASLWESKNTSSRFP